MPENSADIDVSRILNGWVVLYKGKEISRQEAILSLEKNPPNKKKIIAVTLEELINRDGKKCAADADGWSGSLSNTSFLSQYSATWACPR
jgi:hypothetical protein